MVDKSKIQTIIQLIDNNKIARIDLKDIRLKNRMNNNLENFDKGTYQENQIIINVIDESEYDLFIKNIVFISSSKHESIPKFFGVIIEDNKIVGIVYEYIASKSLAECYIWHFDEKQKIKIIKSLSNVLYYVHSNNGFVGNLELDNILIDSSCNIFLINLGILRSVRYYKKEREILYLKFSSPEYFELYVNYNYEDNEEFSSKITTKMDVWSYGCIVSYLFSEILPWTNKYSYRTEKILLQKKPFPVPVKEILENEYTFADEVLEIITKCTIIDHTQRWSMTEIKAITDIL